MNTKIIVAILLALLCDFAFADSSELRTLPILSTVPQSHGWKNGELRPLSQNESESVYKTIEYFTSEAIKGHIQKQLAWFDIHNFYSEIRTVQLYSNETAEAIIGSGHRIGSINLTEQRIVIFNRGLLSTLTGNNGAFQLIGIGNETLFLHEFLGALGYPDEDYLLSSYIWMRTFPDDYSDQIFSKMEVLLEKQIEKVKRRTKNVVFDLKSQVQ